MMRSTPLGSKLLASQHVAQPHGYPEQRTSIALGNPGRCSAAPTLLILDFDNSGSGGAAGANDPVGNRFNEARAAIEAVGRRCRCDRELGAVLHFDSPTSR